MASARDIKRRIKSVKNTQQITKAMKMVSAAKLRKAQAAVTAVRPFMHKIDQMILPAIKRLFHILLPVAAEGEENRFATTEYIFEPDQQTVVSALLPQYIDIGVYSALQEAKASEHGARMTAMNSATDNATEMVNQLTLSLNRARQAAITTEISEIVGGAAALS